MDIMDYREQKLSLLRRLVKAQEEAAVNLNQVAFFVMRAADYLKEIGRPPASEAEPPYSGLCPTCGQLLKCRECGRSLGASPAGIPEPSAEITTG